MHRQIIVLWVVLSWLCNVSAWAQTAPSAATPPNRGTLYRVLHDGHSAYLFGTIHVGQPSFYPLEPVVLRALADAGKLAVELDIRDQAPLKAAVEKYGVLTPPQTLEQVLAADTLADLRQVLNRLAVPFAAVARMKPWMLSNVLLALALEKAGFARDQGIEMVLLGQAKISEKPVVSLETAGYQIGLFDTLDAGQQEQYLRETLQALKSGKIEQQSRELVDAWGRADSDALEKLLQQELSAPTVTADFTRRVLLEQRNPLLAAAIQNLVDAETNSFVAIGSLHLVGPGSVPKLLEKHGYRVEKLY